MKYIRIILISFFIHIHGIFFLNKYLTPQLTISPNMTYKPYKDLFFSLQPFIMTSQEGNRTSFGYQKPDIFEMEGSLSLSYLHTTYSNLNPFTSIQLPSEWKLDNFVLPIGLHGGINTTGIGYNIIYPASPWVYFGLSGAFMSQTSAFSIEPKEENRKNKIKEGYMNEVLYYYNAITKEINIKNNYDHFNCFSDQDIYIKFQNYHDDFLKIKKFQYALQLGTIIPCAKKKDIDNPASIPGGTNGLYALYAKGDLGLLMKEDVNLHFELAYVNELPTESTRRLRAFTEPSLFGLYRNTVSIDPGGTLYFQPELTIEGLRNGLGTKVAYSVWYHYKDKYGIKNNTGIIEQAIMFNEEISGWAQEHCTFTLFYDFMRETEYFEKQYIAYLSAQIPVDFFFSYNSARTFALSFIIEALY